jgi:UDP-3-O-[3-hydroxymyristoyl] glucosamine N-acyltransferase
MQLSDLCEILGKRGIAARLDGLDKTISAVNTLDDAGDGEISFLSNPKYLARLQSTRASAVIVGDGVETPASLSTIRCADPYGAITVAIIALHGHRRHPQWGCSANAAIDATAQIGRNANIAPGAAVAAGVTIGDNCTIYPGCYVGEHARLGDDCTLFPNVVIYDHSELGNRVTIHAGSVIGEDGLGYAPNGDKWVKIPQVGRAVIGDDVEIGANCTIDRATLGTTEIGPGTKFGNVIVIGHGTKVGPDCLFVGLIGVAGSVTIGRHVTLAGQVGVAGHLTIGDGAMVGAQSGISGNIEPQAKVFGSPAMAMDEAKRAIAVIPKLPEWVKRVKELEREVAQLRARMNAADQSDATPANAKL